MPRRENQLKEKFEEFQSLSFPDQMRGLEYYCTEWGLYTSDMDAATFGKVPDPKLQEIQEAQSESFLSFREVLSLNILFIITFLNSRCSKINISHVNL